MRIEQCIKESFAVIGREGSTEDGPGFVQRLWQEANTCFDQVASLAARDENGIPLGFWGVMSDFSHSFRPWEAGFSQGLYLAGVECPADVQPPAGWTKWVIPGFVYLRAECDGDNIFGEMLTHLEQHGITLAGAVHDFTDPKTGKNYMYFPIQKL